MIKKLLQFSLILGLLLCNMSVRLFLNIHAFNSNSVLDSIKYLSSSTFKGRLAGTFENEQAAAYIKQEFIKNNLLPFNNSYYDTFTASYPHRLDNTPYLRIVDGKGNIVKDFIYGEDYKEDLLNFRTNHVTFSKKDSPRFDNEYIISTHNSDKFVFFTPENNNLKFRSSFSKDSAYNMYIMVSRNTLMSMEEYLSKGYTADCYIPFEINETKLNNVTAYIAGKNPSLPPIIISAHFDHLGSDLGNNIYGGALDNASGVSFIIELSKYIKSLGIPERDIVFVSFNAEEFGCLGSEAFVKKYLSKLSGSKAFNFDMIGSNNSVPLYIMGAKNDTRTNNKLMRSISSICDSAKIDVKYLFEDCSDHGAFRKYGIDAVTFADNDMSRIHTPQDRAAFISTKSIDRCSKVISKEVINYAFGGNPLLLYYKQISIISFALIILITPLYVKMKEQQF